jgi:hypothetical protein
VVQPSRTTRRRRDAAARPRVVTTDDDAEVFLELGGRTVFDEAGRPQMLFATFESEDPSYSWLNVVICVGEGRIDPDTLEARIELGVCEPRT